MMQEEAQAAADAWGWQIMPLYLAPRLTDAEREAVEQAIRRLWRFDIADTLRGLLARMSGEAALSYSGQSPSTPPAHPTPAKCTVPPQWTEGGGK
jgi:hypothetical protein